MSATEIIQRIQEMPHEEQRKVFDYLQSHDIGTHPEEADGKISEEFKAIADEVFTKNAEMFRKLAQ